MTYSQHLRGRVMTAIEAGDRSQAKVAELFGVHLSTVEKWLRCWRETGQVAPQPHGGGRHRLLRNDTALVRQLVAEQPDVTLDELRERVAQAGGAAVGRSTLSDELKRLKLRRKKSRSTIVNAKRSG